MTSSSLSPQTAADFDPYEKPASFIAHFRSSKYPESSASIKEH
jgi:hypothetical protein